MLINDDGLWVGPRLSSTSPANWITTHARYRRDVTCVVDVNGSKHSFGDVNSTTNRLVRALRAAGLGSGDRLGILATDSVEHLTTVLACLKAGVIWVPLNYRLSAPELANVSRRAGLGGLLVEDRYESMLPTIESAVDGMKLVHGIGAGSPRGSVADLWQPWTDDSDPEVPDCEEAIISIMFTSGTTGTPKGVLRSMRQLRAMTAGGLVDLQYRPDDFLYSASAMFHTAGIGHILYGLARGSASLVLPQFDAEQLLSWLRRGLTCIFVMPTMLDSLLALDGVEPGAFPELRTIAYGGAPITTELLRRAIDVFDCEFFNCFGAGTEAGGQAILRPSDHRRALAGDEHLLGSIGHPAFGVELRLCDEQMRDVAVGEIGEIYTRTDRVMSGYLDDPDSTARAFTDGWFHAGDLARSDDDGYLYLAGRRDDMIIRGGENVYPSEIETVLIGHPDISEAVIVGVPDSHWGQRVGVALQCAPGRQITASDLREFCSGKLARYKVPTDVFCVDRFPRNANGKVQRHLLVQELLGKAHASDSTDSSP